MAQELAEAVESVASDCHTTMEQIDDYRRNILTDPTQWLRDGYPLEYITNALREDELLQRSIFSEWENQLNDCASSGLSDSDVSSHRSSIGSTSPKTVASPQSSRSGSASSQSSPKQPQKGRKKTRKGQRKKEK